MSSGTESAVPIADLCVLGAFADGVFRRRGRGPLLELSLNLGLALTAWAGISGAVGRGPAAGSPNWAATSASQCLTASSAASYHRNRPCRVAVTSPAASRDRR